MLQFRCAGLLFGKLTAWMIRRSLHLPPPYIAPAPLLQLPERPGGCGEGSRSAGEGPREDAPGGGLERQRRSRAGGGVGSWAADGPPVVAQQIEAVEEGDAQITLSSLY